jgi:hypothetical protein
MGISGGPCVAQLGMRHRQSQGFGQVGLQDLSCCHHGNGVLGSRPRAISISNNLVACDGPAARQPRREGSNGNCDCGVRVCLVPKVGAGKNNMNSGEGHELNGSMDTHEGGCRRLCSIEIRPAATVQAYRRIHRLLQMSPSWAQMFGVCRSLRMPPALSSSPR